MAKIVGTHLDRARALESRWWVRRRRCRLCNAVVGGSKQYDVAIAPGLLCGPCDRLGGVFDIGIVEEDDALALRAPHTAAREDNVRIAAARKNRWAAGLVCARGCSTRLPFLVLGGKDQGRGIAAPTLGRKDIGCQGDATVDRNHLIGAQQTAKSALRRRPRRPTG